MIFEDNGRLFASILSSCLQIDTDDRSDVFDCLTRLETFIKYFIETIQWLRNGLKPLLDKSITADVTEYETLLDSADQARSFCSNWLFITTFSYIKIVPSRVSFLDLQTFTSIISNQRENQEIRVFVSSCKLISKFLFEQTFKIHHWRPNAETGKIYNTSLDNNLFLEENAFKFLEKQYLEQVIFRVH